MQTTRNPEFQAIIERMQRNRRELTPEELAERLEIEQADTRRVLEDRLMRARIPRRFWQITFEEIERRGVPTQVQSQFRAARAYADDLRHNFREGRGLLMAGPPGTLKSTLALAILQASLELQIGGLFVSMPSLIDTASTLAKTDRSGYAEFERRLRNVPILVLDDLGAEGLERWIGAKVDGLIADRWHEQLPIIATTNLTAQELKQNYSERVIDRLRSSCQQINFEGPSQRRKA